MATTPNMGLNQTSAGVTPGPTYATLIDQNTPIIDAHDHTTGKGKPITPAAVNVNADFPFNGHNITNALNITATGKLTGNTYNDWSSVYTLSTATGNGVTDDSAQILIAANAIVTAGGGTLSFPKGQFSIQNNITIPKGCACAFEAGAYLLIATGKTITFLDGIIAGLSQKIFVTTPTDVQPVKFGAPGTVGAPTLPTSGPSVASPMWWGALGDASTDAWSAIQQCIWAFGYNPTPIPILANTNNGIGGTIFIPAGQFVVSKALLLGYASTGLTILGAGRSYGNGGTQIAAKVSTGQDTIVMGGETVTSPAQVLTTAYCIIKNLTVTNNTGGGVPIHMLDCFKCRLEDLTIVSVVSGLNCLWLNGGASNGNISNVTVRECQITALAGQTVPSVILDGGAQTNNLGQLSEVTFTNIELNGSLTATAPQIMISYIGVAGGIGIQNILLEQIRFEVPFGGCVHVFGALNVALKHCTAGDTIQTSNAPMIKLRKAASSAVNLPNGFLLESWWTDIGNVTFPTIDFDNANAGQGPITIANSQLPWIYGGSNLTGPQMLMLNSVAANGATGNTACYVAQTPAGFQGITGLGGISSTNVSSVNLGGSFTILNTAATATITLPFTEADTNYRVMIASTGPAGGSANSYILRTITKNTTNFVVTVAAVTTQNQNFDYFIFR